MGAQMSALKPVEETAKKTGVSVSTLNKWRVAGFGPKFVKLGRRVLYRDEDIEAFITAGIRRSTSETPGVA
jgi:predicted DNA-binding transcriptional regulator AlpA